MSNQISEFKGKYFFLSNFYKHPVEFEGLTYGSNEAAFQAAKCINNEDRKQFIKLIPRDAKYLGRRVTLRKDWESVKIDIMHQILLNKFSDPVLKSKLLATGDSLLVEGNTWGDRFWGFDIVNNVGENYLGKLLMQVRDEIK